MSDSDAVRSSLSLKRQSAQANHRNKYTAKRAEILRASGQVLHRHGISKTTIGLIAKHANVDRATMYYYFEDKYAIYRELILDGLADYFDGIDTVAASASPPEVRLQEAMSTVMQAFEKHYPQLYIFFQAGESAELLGPELYEATVESGRQFEALLDRILHDGVDTGVFSAETPIKVVIKQVVGMLNWTSRWFQPEGELDGVGVANAMAATILNGISADRRRTKRR
jgi:TetR/AcrR family transcriptional regulator, cholesterol catabolism regulator